MVKCVFTFSPGSADTSVYVGMHAKFMAIDVATVRNCEIMDEY
jgi:hypothetical protein